ncbi:MAG TPA: hypothetical protein VJQ49_01115 [Casimicrobiaceae bacterium]|nr:hypothetical protein [Casimicrobiaceae bacterium]
MQATATAAATRAGVPTRTWFRLAILYFIVATGLGLYMGMSEDHTLFPVHAHLNLLGWVSLALTGFLYERFPAATANVWYTIHFWVYNLALPLVMLALALFIKGAAGLGPVVGILSIVLFASIVVFVINLWRSSGG